MSGQSIRPVQAEAHVSRVDAWLERKLEGLLAEADVRLNGPRPWDVQVRDSRLFRRLVLQGTLGLGEAYMDGWWDCAALDELFTRLLTANIDRRRILRWTCLAAEIRNSIINRQSRARSRTAVARHYDLPPSFYLSFLDPFNQYTCAYFSDTDDLAAAQERKLELIASKLRLSADDHLLDVGCGWGGWARYAATRHGCRVTGITLSREQLLYARASTPADKVTICEMDYRDLSGRYDKISAVGVLEHVGPHNYRTFFERLSQCLAEQGLVLVQCIGSLSSVTSFEPWLDKYIFRDAVLPSVRQIAKAVEGLFVIEDLHNFGAHYDRTLLAWCRNLDETLRRAEFTLDESTRRMWRYYFLMCAGTFRARRNQLWQIVLSKGLPGGYSPAHRGGA